MRSGIVQRRPQAGGKVVALECDVGDEAAVDGAFLARWTRWAGWTAASPMSRSAAAGRRHFWT